MQQVKTGLLAGRPFPPFAKSKPIIGTDRDHVLVKRTCEWIFDICRFLVHRAPNVSVKGYGWTIALAQA
ncbi:hypothetical protein ABKN59_006234 [Abortiporus biennis]